MRLAVPFDHGEIYGHFGRTAQFKLYDLTDGRIVSTAIVDTMGNSHGALTGFLKAYAVDALICGGIGAGARLALEEAGSGSIRARPAARMRQSAPFGRNAFLSARSCLQPPQGHAAACLRQPHLLGCLLSRTTGGTLP
ncbi:MAG: NifB/NifX family molybdenum-iron cluster-binding protein [Acutalibacteraceae bacterium]